VSGQSSLLKIESLEKSYGPVLALRNANFEVLAGEIHALLGANGAGKSTLVKILTGVISGNSGSISLNGKSVTFSSPDHARKNGIAPVFQDPALIPDLSIQRNLALTGTNESPSPPAYKFIQTKNAIEATGPNTVAGKCSLQ